MPLAIPQICADGRRFSSAARHGLFAWLVAGLEQRRNSKPPSRAMFAETFQGVQSMYVAGFVIPVPEEKMEAYRQWAENGAALFREYGCIEIVDCWKDNVPRGRQTDFRRAVDAKEGEKIVFSWQVWPDKATLDSAEAKMHEDKRFEV